ncbi:hypothetical protein PMAYCL1PPCAC_20447, partial [Pristionchus mayeri]
HFAAARMVANNAILYGVNIDHDELCAFGEANIPASEAPAPRAPPSPYVGGEWRNETDHKSVFVCIAGNGAALGDVSACAVQAVLMTWLGSQVSRPDTHAVNTGTLEVIYNKYKPATVTCSALYFEGEGLIQFNFNAPMSYVRHLVKEVVYLLKTFKIYNLKEIKKSAKSNMVNTESRRNPRITAADRAKEIFAGVEK